MFVREFCFDGYAQRTPETHPYAYDPYFIAGSRKSVKNATSAYSDRLKLWYDSSRFEAAKEAAKIEGHGDYWWRRVGLAQMSRFLSALTEKDCKCVGIAEGCNVSNGYPYWIIWWRD